MSQTALAYLYEQGLGVAQSFDTSFALLQSAVAQDYGYADAALALHYLFGEGTAVDANKAFGLASTAVQKGAVYANGIVGYMLAEGLGVDRDLSAALTQFQSGAEGGDQYSVGRIPITEAEIACEDAAGSPYEPGGIGHGLDFEAIDADAAIAACQAALEGNPGSIGDGVWLARALVKAGRIDEALPLLAPGVNGGNVLALATYGDLLVAGNGVDPDPSRAIALYDEAAAKGFAPAAFELGRIYGSGEIVPRDATRAAHYFQAAYDAGMEAAQSELAELSGGPDNAANPDLDVGFGEAGAAY
jgi:TPR repeat protein